MLGNKTPMQSFHQLNRVFTGPFSWRQLFLCAIPGLKGRLSLKLYGEGVDK